MVRLSYIRARTGECSTLISEVFDDAGEKCDIREVAKHQVPKIANSTRIQKIPERQIGRDDDVCRH